MKTLLTVAAVAGFTTTVFAQSLTLDELLFRASQSVVAYERVFSNAVAEEHYVQRILRFNGTVRRQRDLRSDMLLVQLPGRSRGSGSVTFSKSTGSLYVIATNACRSCSLTKHDHLLSKPPCLRGKALATTSAKSFVR